MVGFVVAGCSDNMPTAKQLAVESIELKDEVAGGITLMIGRIYDVKNMVTITPEDATDRAENYYSSDPTVAMVSPYGIITALDEGQCVITIAVGGKEACFDLTVIPVPPIPFETIRFTVPEMEVTTATVGLNGLIVTTAPDGCADVLVFESSDPAMATVDANGLVTFSFQTIGDVTIKASSSMDPTVYDQIVFHITRIEYDRTGWQIVEVSHTKSNGTWPEASAADNKNTPTSAFDGVQTDMSSFFMVKPGKNAVDGLFILATEDIWFVVDMVAPREVNYFRHGWDTNPGYRWWGFKEILGSDTQAGPYTSIATDVMIPTAITVSTNFGNSGDIEFPNATYRYLKFVSNSYPLSKYYFTNNGTNWGGSYTTINGVQNLTCKISEMYIGLKVGSVPFTSVSLGSNSQTITTETFDLSALVNTTGPADCNDQLVYTSLSEANARVGSDGMVTFYKLGSVTVKVSSKLDPTIFDQMTFNVQSIEYGRAGWKVVETSHGLPNVAPPDGPTAGGTGGGENNGIYAAFDGNDNSYLTIVKPGKSYGGVSLTASERWNDDVWFVVDMLEAREVNYFRMSYHLTDGINLRWWGFQKIEGSNAQTGPWTQINTSDVMIVNAKTLAEKTSEDVAIPSSTYRFLKFTANGYPDNTYFDITTGNGRGSSNSNNSCKTKELFLGAH